MKIEFLIVEDDPEFRNVLVDIVNEVCPDSNITEVGDQDAAFQAIREHLFDLIILDLNIPKTSESFDGHPDYGHEVFTNARNLARGTPVIVLTGSTAEPFIPSMLKLGEQADIWGSNKKHQLVAFHEKHKLDSFHAVLAEYTDDLNCLRQVEIQRTDLDLNEHELRTLRIFARKYIGVKCAVSSVTGGHSGAKVLKLKTTKDTGAVVNHTICKIGQSDKIRDEDHRYNQHITSLPPEATPRKLILLEHGAKMTSGLFYSLASGYPKSAFSENVMTKFAQRTISEVSALMKSWVSEAESRKKISELRNLAVGNEIATDLISLYGLDWATKFEQNEIQVKWGLFHGDMHGFNILVSDEGHPILIDYGDTGIGPSSYDPITLELSLFFHREGPLTKSHWPTKEQAENWFNLELYLEGCPFPDFVKNCREWALQVAAGDREVLAVAYSYLLRQLKYTDVDKTRVIQFLEGIKSYYDQT